MSFTERFSNLFKFLLPAPFTIAVLLTGVTFLLALFITPNTSVNTLSRIGELLEYWENGIWNGKLLVFALQMMLMLVLGHVLALTKTAEKFINAVVKYCNNTANAAAIVTLLTCSVALFNWGLGLIFGAVFARKVGEYARANNTPLNYPIIGAAGYSGLMVWHGGLSGSAPIKIAEAGHFLEDKMGVISQNETIFSSMNICTSILILTVLPIAMYIIGKKSITASINLPESSNADIPIKTAYSGAEKIDHSNIPAFIFGGLIIALSVYNALIKPETLSLEFITPNYINFLLLGLGIVLHGSFSKFLKAVDDAISGAAGILIQFPLYFGIMGIMNSSGLVQLFSDFFVSISNEVTFPLFTMMSAGIVNVFVPSGGGQWAVQGPIIIEAANQLNVSIPKSVMALAYGDQLTNMLQPFWALPLLGITGLKAKEILPYTLYLMFIGGSIYLIGLLVF